MFSSLARRDVKSAWSRAGLFPFYPDKVLHDIPRPLPVDVFTQQVEVSITAPREDV